MANELGPEQLLRRVDETGFAFATTADVAALEGPVAQTRAREAVDFGVGIKFPGYNVYALGPAQTDKRSLILGTEVYVVTGVRDLVLRLSRHI